MLEWNEKEVLRYVQYELNLKFNLKNSRTLERAKLSATWLHFDLFAARRRISTRSHSGRLLDVLRARRRPLAADNALGG